MPGNVPPPGPDEDYVTGPNGERLPPRWGATPGVTPTIPDGGLAGKITQNAGNITEAMQKAVEALEGMNQQFNGYSQRLDNVMQQVQTRNLNVGD
jgi:hypothetical protein